MDEVFGLFPIPFMHAPATLGPPLVAGIDHLLFVAGLLFLVGFRRRLIGTITASPWPTA
jgi:hypothetical protein